MHEKLYSYAVILRPTREQVDQGKRSELVVTPCPYFLAASEQEVVMIAAKKIPEQYLAMADRLEVAVSPF